MTSNRTSSNPSNCKIFSYIQIYSLDEWLNLKCLKEILNSVSLITETIKLTLLASSNFGIIWASKTVSGTSYRPKFAQYSLVDLNAILSC
jgi:hypothetical protein